MAVRKLDIPRASHARGGGRGETLKRPPLEVEAAQFALLRRLAPSLRHRLIGGLHPISLLTELAGRRLAADSLDLASARDAVSRVQAQARVAADSAIATIAWLTGEEAPSVALNEGVAACVALVRTDCEMRGAVIVVEVGDVEVAVPRRALRTVLTAALIAAVDTVPHPARIELHAGREGDGIELRVEVRALQESASPAFSGDERPLTWEDVRALARLEGVEIRATGTPSVFRCRFRPCAAT